MVKSWVRFYCCYEIITCRNHKMRFYREKCDSNVATRNWVWDFCTVNIHTHKTSQVIMELYSRNMIWGYGSFDIHNLRIVAFWQTFTKYISNRRNWIELPLRSRCITLPIIQSATHFVIYPISSHKSVFTDFYPPPDPLPIYWTVNTRQSHVKQSKKRPDTSFMPRPT